MLFNCDYQKYYSKEDKGIIKEMIINSQFETKYRKEFYLIASGARLSLSNFPNYYNDIIVNFPIEIPSFDAEKIKVDLNRTFPTNIEFINNKGEEKLGRILLAFSRRNPSMGYCQGFNFIAGRSLLVTENEEEAFWLFTHIMEDILPLNYFSNLYGVTIDHNIILSAVQKKHKDMFDYLHKASYSYFIDDLINKWFFSLFIVNINEQLSFAIWDLLMIEETALIKSSMSLIKLISELITTIDLDGDKALDNLNNIVKSINNEIKFFKNVQSFKLLTYSNLETRRRQENAIINSITKEEEKPEKECQAQVKCNILWNVCLANKKIKNEVKLYLIHKGYSDPKLYNDYFSWKEDIHQSMNINLNDNYFEMLIERIPHKCQMALNNHLNLNKN